MVNSDADLSIEGCEYTIIREGSYNEMLDFLRDHFWPHEPLSNSLNVLMGDELRNSEREVLKQNLSIAVVQRGLNVKHFYNGFVKYKNNC